MTTPRPHARQLLEVTRETLRESVAPQLDGVLRYEVLMAANALAIALRELQADCVVGPEAALRELYGNRVPAHEPLERLERRLAGDIRRGEFDGASQGSLRAALRARVEAQLAISNPRRLQR